jgi:hypothetical protein
MKWALPGVMAAGTRAPDRRGTSFRLGALMVTSRPNGQVRSDAAREESLNIER